MAYADLHIHSTVSDGTLTPEEIVRLCRENGVGALSVTDHDAVEGTLRAAPLARAAGLVYVCGVEIDTLWEGRDVHVLCYGADLTNAALLCLHPRGPRAHGQDERRAANAHAGGLSRPQRRANTPPSSATRRWAAGRCSIT